MTTPVTRDLLRRLPKAELHCHLDGSVRPATLLELGREYHAPMPRITAEELADYMRVDDARNLEDYLARFDITLRVMQTADALERIAYELAEDAASEGVRYIEVRYAPVLNVRGGLTLEQAVEAPLRGLRRAEREHGVIGRVLVCSLRHLPPPTSLDLARLAVDFKHEGVVGFDLAGGEAGNPAANHAEAFLYAREHDLACTCHAGEGDGPDSVRQAVHLCGAHRVGHGTHLIADPSLTEYVNDRRIAVEICLTSNVQTRAAASYEAHPFRAYFDRGLNVVLNTDNRLMSGTTLVDEYAHAAEHLDFTTEELCRVARNGFESAFLPYQEREALLAKVEAEIAALVSPAEALESMTGNRAARPLPVATYGRTAAARAANFVRTRLTSDDAPVLALILGSGLGGIAERIDRAVRVPFADVPGFPAATVAGHRGELIAGELGGRRVVALAGRFHLYEGHTPALAAFPVRVLHALGARALFVSNAAGGIRRTFRAGDLMLIADHINLMWRSPLIGTAEPHDARFPDMSEPYSYALATTLRTAARAARVPLQEGVYAGLLGPSYETPAEVRMLDRLGADAVGMSTVPEVIVAQALGMPVAGVSCITNLAAGISPERLSHADVLETTRRVAARFENLVIEFVRAL